MCIFRLERGFNTVMDVDGWLMMQGDELPCVDDDARHVISGLIELLKIKLH
jgi:hypothetical protein